jgi:hypothetical protein
VDSRPRMNTRFGTRPTDGCTTGNDGRKAGWEGRGTRSRGQGESSPCRSDDATTAVQDAAPTTLTPQHDSPSTLSIPIAHPSDFLVRISTGLNHRIRFSDDAERLANGLRIASASAEHSASIPRSLSAVRILLFTFWARNAGPLNKVRFWRTRIAQLAHTRCAPVRHSSAHSGGHRGMHLSGHARGQRFRKDRARCGVRPFRLQSQLSRTPKCAWVTPVDECPRARGADSALRATRTWSGLRSAPSCGFCDPHRCGATSAQHSRSGVRTSDCT